jgi:hypothetical protein
MNEDNRRLAINFQKYIPAPCQCLIEENKIDSAIKVLDRIQEINP